MSHDAIDFGQREIASNPAHRRILSGAIAAAVVLHLVVIVVLVRTPRHTPVRVGIARQDGISAFVNVASVPAGTTGARPTVSRSRAVNRAPADAPAAVMPVATDQLPGSEQPAAAAQGGAPVRMTTGQLQLINRVEPVYPRLMIAARVEGTVVLDAIIHADGTIGDITILKSLAPLFDRAAVDAVKRWRYTPLGYEGVVTVTVNFSLR
jgi:TonB family protein